MKDPNGPHRDLDAWLDLLLDLSPQRRREILDAECTDPELRTRIERILAAETTDLLDEGPAGMAPRLVHGILDQTGASDAPGTVIGEYRLVRELGRGGMGTVHLAERIGRDFSQKVALKLVKRGMDSDAIVARFTRERRILARLQHEGIARLLDGGTAGDGRPFLVMEYVDGRPVTAYCDERRLPVDERLRLFLDACRAVQHAHTNLVIHRDLKPSNVLVTNDGRLKLLDFGIAAILDGEGSDEATTLTVAGRRPLTPEYAAPEQLAGEPTTTATDVYGLGVLLYHLLTGKLPYRFPRGEATVAARSLHSGEPARPSAAIRLVETVEHGDGTTDTRSALRVAEDRATRPHHLSRSLAGDLDAIVMKALRKEPEQRYRSVEAMADDIRRHLEGDPVRARRGTLRYRAGKFARRHAFALGVAAASLFATFGFGIFHVRALAHERDLATREAARAEQVSQFILDVFDRSDPWAQAAGDSLGIEELVDAGVARLQNDLVEQPELRSELEIVMGRLMLRLGRGREGRDLFQSALGTREELLGEDSPEATRAAVFLADAEGNLGRYAEAATLERRILAHRREPGTPPRDLASALEELGRTETALGNFARADSLLTEALEVRRTVDDDDPLPFGNALTYMGTLRREQGRMDEAADYTRQALETFADHYGEDHSRTRQLRGQLALVLNSAGRYEEAEPIYRKVLAGHRAQLGEDHPTTASARHNLGSLLLDMRRYDEAEVLLRRALADRERTLGPNSAVLGPTLSKLATVLTHQGAEDEALELHRRAVEIRRINYGPRSTRVATGLNQLGITLNNMGRPEEAIPVLREAADIYREGAGERHRWVAVAVGNEARAWHRLGDLSRADSLYRLRYDINLEALGSDHYSTANALHWSGRVALQQGRWEDAASALGRALPVYEARLDEGDTRLAELQSELGEALSRLGRFTEAEPLLRASVDGMDHPLVRRRLEEHLERASRSGSMRSAGN